MQRRHPGFSSPPPLDHALHRLKPVKAVAVGPAAGADHHGLFHLGARGNLQRGKAPGHRNAGTGHQCKVQFPGRFHHLLGPFPFPGKMLVVEHRHTAAACPEDVHDLPEELVARIHGLPLLVPGVASVLTDQQNPVDRQTVSTQRQGFGDGGIELHRWILTGPVAAEVALPDLVHKERHHIHGGPVKSTVPAVAAQKTVHDVLAVGPAAVLSDQGGDLRTPGRPGATSGMSRSAAGIPAITVLRDNNEG